MRFRPAPRDIRLLAEWRTWLITFNYISFKFENPLKERIALAAGRCLPTRRGNRGLLCLNYVMLPWAAALGGGGRCSTWACLPQRPRGALEAAMLSPVNPTLCWPVTWDPRSLKDGTLRRMKKETQQRLALGRESGVGDGESEPTGPPRTERDMWGRGGEETRRGLEPRDGAAC